MRSLLDLVRKRSNVVAVVAGVFVIGYICLLVGANYLSQVELQESALEQLRQDMEKRATAVNYFCSERKNDLKNLIKNRAISGFFENKALGMSMEYGLRSSLLGISKTFDHLLANRKLGEERIYTRIVFIDASGKLLVDSQPERQKVEHELDWKTFLTPEKQRMVVIDVYDGQGLKVIISTPYFFKNRYAGQILAWISSKTVYRLVEETKESAKRSVYLVCGSYLFPLPADMQYVPVLYSLTDPGSARVMKTHRFEQVKKDGSRVDMFAMVVPTKETPLFLVTLLPVSEVFGHMAPWHLPLAMGALAIIILGGMAGAFRINTQKLILHARLEETSKKEQEIEEKNRQLGREISIRERAEEALRKAHDDLEIRVKERTRELAESNVLLKREIEERKRAVEKLLENEERMKAILRASPVGIGLVINRQLEWANETMYRIVGYELGSLLGQSAEVLYPDDEEYERAGRELYAGITKSGIGEVETRWVRKDGTIFNCKLRGCSLDPTDYFKGQILAVVDITEHKKLEAQLIQSQKMEAIGTLAGGVAHDFNNILTTIIVNAELTLMDFGKDNPLHEVIEEIKKAGERAASLTRQLLAFSRKQVLQPVILNLNSVTTNLEKMLRRLIGEDVELETLLEPDLREVEADPGQIEQVIMNLAVNARDAMPQGGKLTIETANVDLGEDYFRDHGVRNAPGSYVILSVSDTGSGMDRETQSRIFEPFFTTKETGKGTGLGLSTVYGIIKQSNGYIWVYSEPGKGTAFKIYLPKVAGDAETEEMEKTSMDDLTGSETVLIVEDDDRLLNLARKILQLRGYTVLEAKNGEEALRIAEEHGTQIDLLLTDVVMPVMGGRELAERLQPLRPEMKVIYMSGYTDDTIVHHGVLMPEVNFIEKPFTLEALAHKIREVLDK